MQLWAVGYSGSILHGAKVGFWPYISQVRLLPKPPDAQLQVRVIASQSGADQVKIKLSGSNHHAFEKNAAPEQIPSVNHSPSQRGDPWTLDYPGAEAHLRIELEDGTYKTYYDAGLTYDPYHSLKATSEWSKEHWARAVGFALVAAFALLVAAFTVLLFTRPLWILYLYRKRCNLIEQIELPGVGKLLHFLLKFTVLPWFVTHPRTLGSWISANRDLAAAAWTTSFKTPTSTAPEKADVDVPYVALPVQVKDVSSRSLHQPAAKDFEGLFHGVRSVVQIVGPGGGGKTTLAKHIGDLALAGGEIAAFQACRLPIWVDEDFTDLRAVVKRKLNGWYKAGEDIEELLINALLENGLLLVMVDRVSERLPSTREYLGKVHGTLRCNALVITTRVPIAMEVPEQQFIYPQALDSGTLLNFMTLIIKYYFQNREESEARPFSTIKEQLELGNRLADLITVRTGIGENSREIPMLPLPVVLFISDAVSLVKQGRSLEDLPKSLPDVYAKYLRRINPKVPGIEIGRTMKTCYGP
jgi:hypothetical protein